MTRMSTDGMDNKSVGRLENKIRGGNVGNGLGKMIWGKVISMKAASQRAEFWESFCPQSFCQKMAVLCTFVLSRVHWCSFVVFHLVCRIPAFVTIYMREMQTSDADYLRTYVESRSD